MNLWTSYLIGTESNPEDRFVPHGGGNVLNYVTMFSQVPSVRKANSAVRETAPASISIGGVMETLIARMIQMNVNAVSYHPPLNERGDGSRNNASMWSIQSNLLRPSFNGTRVRVRMTTPRRPEQTSTPNEFQSR